MKKTQTIITLIAALILSAAMTSCKKEGVASLEGSYTYKLGGSIALVQKKDGRLSAKAPIGGDDTLWVVIPTEHGQMHIVEMERGEDRVLVTFNPMGRAPYTAIGNAPERRALSLSDGNMRWTIGDENKFSGNVTFTGQGNRYDEVLSLKIDYTGLLTTDSAKYTIVRSLVNCIATANEDAE